MSSIVKKLNNLKEIPSVNYEGYIWMSNETEPKVLKNEKYDFSAISQNPFIIEGLLYDKTSQKSFHIQHVGECLIYEYNLDEVKSENLVPKEYLPHRLKEVEKVCFKQIWEEEEDKNCEGFPVLNLKVIVFCGFKK